MTEPNNTDDIERPNSENSGIDKSAIETAQDSMPNSIKYGLLSLIVLAAGISSAVFIAADRDNEPVFDEGELTELVGSEPASIDLPDKKHVTKSIANDGTRNEEVIAKLKTTVSELQSNVNAYESTLDNYKSLLNEQDIKFRQYDEEVADLKRDSILPLSNHISSLERGLSELKGSVSDNKNRIYKFTKTSPSRPPFYLLSIDQWGNASSAVLELNGKQSLAAEGDIRAGWKINQIIKPNCIHTIRLSDRKKAKVCRSGNA